MFARLPSSVVLAILLLSCGCRSNEKHGYKDDPQLTPLMNAARHNGLPRVRTLLNEGANLKARTAQAQTAQLEAPARRRGPQPGDVTAYNLDPDPRAWAAPYTGHSGIITSGPSRCNCLNSMSAHDDKVGSSSTQFLTDPTPHPIHYRRYTGE